jgi:hypothetical protein
MKKLTGEARKVWRNLHDMEDLSLPRVILVESTWIRGLHGCSMDSMEFFLAVDTPKFSFSVHGLSTDNPHITMIFIIFMESMRIVHGLHMD